MSRRKIQYSSLTSLLDVVLILTFAALLQAAILRESVAESPSTPPTLIEQQTASALLSRGTVEVWVNKSGQIALKNGKLIASKLVTVDPDPAVELIYTANEQPSSSLCSLVAAHVSISGKILVVSTKQPLADFPIALSSGLQNEEHRCYQSHNALVVVIGHNMQKALNNDQPKEK